MSRSLWLPRGWADACRIAVIAAVCALPAAAAAQTTTISGTVYDPRTTSTALPLPNVLVYAKTGAVAPLTNGVQCLTFKAPTSAASYAYTAVDGTFTLKDVPVNTAYTLVIQAGKWRRQFAVTVGTAPVTGLSLHMPADHTQGDIPLIAIATGMADGVECVFRDMGIADTEFTDDTGTTNPGGRIHLYQGSGQGGAYISSSTPMDTVLTGDQATLNGYDMVMFACQGGQFAQSPAGLGNVVSFANAGGRVFTTHYSYVWLDPETPYDSQFPPVANWDIDQNEPFPDPGIATVNTGFTDGATLAQWLKNAGATYQGSSNQIQIGTLRHDFDGVIPPTQAWLTLNNTSADNPVMQMTFNTPVGAAASAQCGRVLFNEYHVIPQLIAPEPYPTECVPVTTMSAQEQMLEYALFDLSTFVQPIVTPTVSLTFDPSPLIVKQQDTYQVTVNVTNTSSSVDIDSAAALAITLPADVTATAIADATGGWICTLGTLKCTRTTSMGSSTTDSVSLTLAVGAYPPGGLPSPTGLITAVVSSPTFSSNVTETDTVVFQQVPGISWATPAPIVYGTPLSAVQLDATATQPGAMTYTPAAGTVLTPGQHALSVSFAPTDALDYTPASASVMLTVVPATPQVQVTASANPVFVSNAVTFTANVASSVSSPTGTVTFYDGAAAIGTGMLSGGTATLTTSSLAFGNHSITAAYGGDSNYHAATSGSMPENVEDFSLAIAGGGGSATVYPGAVASYPLVITPLGGSTLAGTIQMSVSGLPAGTTGRFAPDNAQANSPATDLTLNVTPQGLASARPAAGARGTGAIPLTLGVLLLPFSSRLRKARHRWLLALMFALGTALSLGVAGCSNVTYTPQTFSLTVTASSGNLSHTADVKLTVE